MKVTNVNVSIMFFLSFFMLCYLITFFIFSTVLSPSSLPSFLSLDFTKILSLIISFTICTFCTRFALGYDYEDKYFYLEKIFLE